jgi:hypothetical protein
VLFSKQNKTKYSKMEVVITYIKGYPKKTNLTYRPIEDDVVERIVAEYEQKEQKERKEQKTKTYKNQKKHKKRKLVISE